MNWFSFLFRRNRGERQLAALVRLLSDACQSDVWDRVRDHVFSMELAEARGYIRARAMAPVRQRLPLVIPGAEKMPSALRTRVAAHATDRLVQRIICELASGSSVGRRAA
jgi:hypothetical protein